MKLIRWKADCGEVHHIKSFALYPELRFDINNGITTCRECHLERLGRNFIGIDIKPEYCEMSRRRLSKIPEKIINFIKTGLER
jgi:hypothetical protein